MQEDEGTVQLRGSLPVRAWRAVMLGTLQSTCHQAFLQEVAGLACHAGLDWQLAECTWCSLQPGSQGRHARLCWAPYHE